MAVIQLAFGGAVAGGRPLRGGGSAFEFAGARRGGHTGLDEDARLGLGDLAGTQVSDGARLERRDAAEADAHAAPGGHEYAGLLADVQQRRGAVRVDGLAGGAERDLAAVTGD